MTLINGFELIRKEDIPELRTGAAFYRHEKTGAELLSLSNDDENKVFGITFRTPPKDSTGVAHILEHSVLCGSRKYPVKEPFVELLKGSLNTFLNAFTYPDKTCYPVASQNLRDFYNLIDVYLDAVFYPRLTRFIFQQEGWHYEVENNSSPLVYQGVVYNEMKGAYSSPDNLVAEYSLQSLFPDTPYGLDSGGDPKKIPDLSFEQFRDFHRTYYHPSNARVFFYGDDDPEERLRYIDTWLKDYSHATVDSTIVLQAPFDRPRRIERSFMVGRDERAVQKGMITLNWLLSETVNVEINFSLRILGYILLGMPASPLRKALIDSGLGEDLTGGGLGTELRQITFSAGLKGVEMRNIKKIDSLVMETLEKLARQGLDIRTTEAAFNTIEFYLRENNAGRFPRGLLLMLRSLTTWLYDGDPLSLLKFEEPLNKIKTQLKSDNSFFEKLIESCFLTNTHCTVLTLKPDPDLRETEEDAEKDRLSGDRSAMSSTELDLILSNSRELKKIQETPDSPEALATIPVLSLSDLDQKNKKIPVDLSELKKATTLTHELFTNDIAYLDIGFDLHTVKQEYLPYVPLFGRALLEMGTEKEDFVSLTQRIGRKTGGIRPQIFSSVTKDGDRAAARLFLRGKAIFSKVEDLTRILHDVLMTPRLDNRERFKQMLMEEKARAEQKLVQSGHEVVGLRMRAHFNEAHWVAEQMNGISNLQFLRRLIESIEEKWPEVLAVLQEMLRTLVNRRTMIVNATFDGSNRSSFDRCLENFLGDLPEADAVEAEWHPDSPALFEGMIIPSKVNYVGKAVALHKPGYRFHGSFLVVSRYVRNTYLWEKIRVQGGAYGAFCHLDRFSGLLDFVSYRDPHLVKTVGVFDDTPEFLKEIKIYEDELTKSIIGAIRDLDMYKLPDARGYRSLLRFLTGDTEEVRQQMRDEILGTRPEDFGRFAHVIKGVKEDGIVKVLGSQSSIKEATAARPGWLEVQEVL